MKKLSSLLAATLFALPAVAQAADHRDGPLATSDPAADINDVFVWTSPDTRSINLAMSVFPGAGAKSRFSDAIDYVFHTQSRAAYGQPIGGRVDIACRFDKKGKKFRCSAGKLKEKGEVGKIREDKRFSAYAGLRDDPFFFNLGGFSRTAATVRAVKGGLTYDAAGCPKLDNATSAVLVNMLKSDANGGPPVDSFLNRNVLALVVQIDTKELTRGGALVSVWAGTHVRANDDDDDDHGDHGDGGDGVLGPLVDRMGRPGVNTAVTNPFELVVGKTIGEAQDEYNENGNPGTWGASFSKQFASSLAVLDALDANCGNQLIAKPLVAGMVPPDRYAGLAGVLADDRLYLNSKSGTCGLYLAVEADVVGLAPGNGDCGGRTPLENTIDETYSLFAIGQPAGVTNGILSDANGDASLVAFPFLRAPNP